MKYLSYAQFAIFAYNQASCFKWKIMRTASIKRGVSYLFHFTFLSFQWKTSFLHRSLVLKIIYPRGQSKFQFYLAKVHAELRLTVSRVSNARDCNLRNRHESFAHIVTNCRCAWIARNELFPDVCQSSPVHFCFSICCSPFACPSSFFMYAPDRNKGSRNTLAPKLKNC